MAAKNPYELEFEDFLKRRDIQISKVLTTPKGDEVRAILTASNTVILTGLGDSNGDTIIYTGDDKAIPLLGEIWDAVKGGAGAIWDKLTRGQNCTPKKVTVLETHKDGTVSQTTTETVECRPA